MTPSEWHYRLDSFAALKPGWDSYDADPPTPAAVASARSFLEAAEAVGLEPKKVNPSVTGGVGITFRGGPVTVYAEFRNTGSFLVLFEDDEERHVTTMGNISADHVIAAHHVLTCVSPIVEDVWVGQYRVVFPGRPPRTLYAPHGTVLTSEGEELAARRLAAKLWNEPDPYREVAEAEWYE